MNKDQAGGIFERMIYGGILFVVLRYGPRLGLTSDDAAWIAGGGVTLVFGVWAWLHNRPVSVLNRAAEAIPQNAELAIVTGAHATSTEKFQAVQLANAASDKVVAKTN
jgi:hypothetical protein